MKLDHYHLRANESFLEFEFDSKGPKGVIKKIVLFTPKNSKGITYFNLGFGDFNPNTGEVDDLVISDNKDSKKILATIAATVVEFLDQFPDLKVYAEGSTKSRTRLYQMAIMTNLHQISLVYEIFGFYKGKWQKFEKNINYEAFLVRRKRRNFKFRKK